MRSYKKASDKELVEWILDQDEKAFQALYYRYYDALYAYLWYRLDRPDTVKDMIQEIFTRLWIHHNKLKPEKSIKAYLYQTANNLFIDYLRKNKSRQNYLGSLLQKQFASEENYDDSISVKSAIERLPVKMKQVFIMSRYDGLTYQEIAEILGISIKGIESRMTQALKLLREFLS